MLKAVKTLIDNVFTESKSAPLPVTLPPQVDTLEKAQSFYDSTVEKKRKIYAAPGNPERREFMRKQVNAANDALAYHQVAARIDALPLIFEADSKQIKEAIESTKAAVSTAEKALQAVTKKHDDLTRRLAPLTEKLNAEAAQVQERIEAAQKLFDAAMASGNEADEAAAAEALALAKINGQTQTHTDSPVEIRVSALKKELLESQVQRDEAEKTLACAVDNFQEARANFSKFQYDQKVFDLANFAVKHQEEFGSIETDKRICIDLSRAVFQINSPSRFPHLEGNTFSFSHFLMFIKKPPTEKIIGNFDLYAQNVDDIQEAIQQQEQESRPMTFEEIKLRKMTTEELGIARTYEELKRREMVAAQALANS